MGFVRRILPFLEWGRRYGPDDFRADVIAGTIVLFITVPQAIAYAFLAGMPPQAGLYAAIMSLASYALFGGSRTLAVGPAAIIAIMTLEAASRFAEPQTTEFVGVAIQLALLTGVLLIVLRIINFGAVISFLSHAVVTGFIAAAAILIISNQFPPLLGMSSPGDTSMIAVLEHLATSVAEVNPVTVGISVSTLALLLFCRSGLAGLLGRLNLGEPLVNSLVKSAPMYAVVVGIVLVAGLSLDTRAEVAVVGEIPTELPSFHTVFISFERLSALLSSALLIAMVVFMESTSIGTAVASKRREKIDPNQELIGLGAANIGSSLVGGFPVAGSFARTLVNFSSGAVSPMSSMVTAALTLVTLLWLADFFYYLPKSVLSVIIVVGAAGLIDIHGIRKIFAFNPADAVTFVFTFCMVLALGVEMGILIGIVVSFVLLIRASSRPHIAVVGRWGDTEHFRNVLRHEVKTDPSVLAVRIDESLYFVNTRYIETFLLNRVADSKEIRHVLLICTATNFIDSAGLEMLERLSDNLYEVGVTLHLSEVKGPVMDRLKETDFYDNMHGRVFFTTDIAMKELADV